jgi:hypothetical protein
LGKQVLERVFRKRDFTEEERAAVLTRLENDMFCFQEEYGFDVSKWGWLQGRKASVSRQIA